MESELSPRATEIVACAQSLLTSNGYNGFSYADIADSVKISKASIHHHFPTKSDLVVRVVRRYREAGREGMAALKRQITDPAAQLKAYTGYWEACIRDGSHSFCVCAMLAAEIPSIPEEVAAEVRGHFKDLAAWLTTVLADGSAKKLFRLQDSPKAEALTLMASVHGAMLAARAYGDPKVFSAIVGAKVQQLLRT